MAKQTWLVLLTCASVANCAKLLTVALMGGSHTFMMDEISNILASGGHNVFNFHQMVYLLDGPKTTRGNYTYIPWTIGGNYPEMHRKVKQAFAQNALRGDFKQSALRTSKQLRFQPFTAAELTNRWIESILKVGSGEHLKPHSYQMPTYQLYLLDICGFALAAAVLIIFCAYKVLRSLIHQAMARFHPTKAGEKQKTT